MLETLSAVKPPREFVRFCLVGMLNTGVDFAVFSVLTLWNFPLWAAQVVAYSAGVLNSFLLNRTWTFGHRGQANGQLAKFLTINLFVLALTYELLSWFHDDWGMPMLVSKLLVIGLGFTVNFTGNRLWVFR